MKNKVFLILIHVVIFSPAYSQNVNGLLIDATNAVTRDASAAFEINANTNTIGSPLYGGLLLPRVALTGTTDAATISGTEATSLLVYNTTTISDVTPGFYYWESGAWKRIIAGNTNFPTGTGTQNYVTKWNNAAGTTIGNSQIFDNATNVGISSATPGGKLDVNGGPLTLSAGYLDINRDSYVQNGISWYAQNYPSWSTYMSPGTQTATGPHADLTAPQGIFVTSWALRNYIENAGGYGWTFESAANTTTPTVKFEIRASDGLFHTYGNGIVDGSVGIGTTAPSALLHIWGAHSTTQSRLTLPAVNNGGGTGEVNLQLWVSEPGVSWDAGGIGTNVTNNNGTPSGFGRINTGLGQSYIRFITNGGAMAFNTTNNAGTYYQTMYMVNGNVGISTTNPQGKLHIVGDFYNQNMEGLNSTSAYNLAWNATAQAVDFGATDYVTLVKADAAGTNGSSVLIVANVNVTGNTLTMAQGGGCCPGNNQIPSVVWLANGTASYNVTVQRATDAAFTAGLTNLVTGSAMVGLQVGDYYMQAQATPILNANGFSGNRFLYGNNVSLTYFDDPAPGTYYYRLLITPGGFQKTGGNYSVNDRSLSVVQIKR
ncbi:MAG: hypothetical protein POELPBGB_01047 [Bacteroidia bacterium]|nr:hypothetical protein [Bacteroidia bacterium]